MHIVQSGASRFATLSLLLAALLLTSPQGNSADRHETDVDTNGVTLKVVTYGDVSDPAVVLMHGWMGTSHTWRKVAPVLAKHWFVIVPDMRGHGGSDKPEAGYDAINLATDIVGLLDHYSVEEAHIVGHDMGALVSLAFAGAYPQRALSMTYLDEPLVGYNLDQFTNYREETYGGYWHFGFNSAPGLIEILVDGNEQAFVDWFVPKMRAPNPDAVTAEDRAIYAAGLKTEGGIAGSVGWYRATFETARQLRQLGDAGVKVPMMAWGGAYGIPITHEQFTAIADDVVGGVIPNVGHLLPDEAPEVLVRELNLFYEGIQQAAVSARSGDVE